MLQSREFVLCAPLPEDALFYLSCTFSMGFSQIQNMDVGRGGDCSCADDRVVLTNSRSVPQRGAVTLSIAPCMRIWLCRGLAVEMCISAMPFMSSSHRNPTVPWTGSSNGSNWAFGWLVGFVCFSLVGFFLCLVLDFFYSECKTLLEVL